MIIIIILGVASIVSVIVGIVGTVRLRTAREESGRLLLDEPPAQAAAATRRLVGWYERIPEDTSDISPLADRADAEHGELPPAVLSGRGERSTSDRPIPEVTSRGLLVP